MGGLGGATSAASGSAAGSAATSSAISGAAGATAATGGLAAPLMAVGVGMGAYDLLKSQRDSKKQLQQIRKEQLINQQNKSNILEQQLSTRRARLGSMGISSSGSAAVVNDKLINDTFTDIAQDDEAFRNQSESINDEYKEKLRKQYLSAGMGLTNKVIK